MSHTKKILLETLKAWAPLAAVIVIFTFAIYGTVQQNYRQNANDPQIQIAEEVVKALTQGAPVGSNVPEKCTTDISKSLSPFVQIYDSNNKLVGSTIILDGNDPVFPSSVLDKAKNNDKQIRITWQPKKGVRLAAVVQRYKNDKDGSSGVVIAGKSIREIEARSMDTLVMSAIAGALALIVTFLLVWLFKKMDHPKTISEHNHTSF